jgi:hypothetical protein
MVPLSTPCNGFPTHLQGDRHEPGSRDFQLHVMDSRFKQVGGKTYVTMRLSTPCNGFAGIEQR